MKVFMYEKSELGEGIIFAKKIADCYESWPLKQTRKKNKCRQAPKKTMVQRRLRVLKALGACPT